MLLLSLMKELKSVDIDPKLILKASISGAFFISVFDLKSR